MNTKRYTQEEALQIKRLLKERSMASPDKQKGIRNKLRCLGFYISDFWAGFSDMDFDNEVKNGRIQITNFIAQKNMKTLDEILTIEKDVLLPGRSQIKQSANISDITKKMIDGDFKKMESININQLSYSGLYCIKISKKHNMPKKYQPYLKNHRIIYIGKADDLGRRLGQELFAKGHGTFFRSIGAALGYRPQPGSLLNKKNKKNYTFHTSDEQEIIKWLKVSIEVNWVKHNDLSCEKELIMEYKPLFNLKHNPEKLNELEEDRDQCRKIALAQ